MIAVRQYERDLDYCHLCLTHTGRLEAWGAGHMSYESYCNPVKFSVFGFWKTLQIELDVCVSSLENMV